jgi:DNA-binding response OmpR family regulator
MPHESTVATVVVVGSRTEPSFRALADGLRKHGLTIEDIPPSPDVQQQLLELPARCLVVDLRSGDGALDLVAWYRATLSHPVLTITDQADVLGRIRAVELRVADHLVAPFAISEAVARVEALLRDDRQSDRRRFADITVDPDQRVAYRDGVLIDLTPRELGVLLTLMRNRGRVISKHELLAEVWPDRRASANAVEAVISALRRKLHAEGTEVIHTVHRAGYILRVSAPGVPSHTTLRTERARLSRDRLRA